MSEIVSKPDYSAVLVSNDGKATAGLQLYLDDITVTLNTNLLGNQVQLTSYAVADLPDASTAGGMIFVSDESGGAVMAFSNGTNWLRCTDRVVVT